ncbi:MAG: M20/M25/M40 family metallo-hydrolase [Actinobacteria bacterium]|nr:M20/M25/M40 family metallo-hydrolase [Actinomycetota bacterium]
MTGGLTPSRERLTELFLMLTALPSPSRSEREVAEAVIAGLRAVGVAVQEDGAGPATGGDTGNLWGTVDGDGEGPRVVLGAHLDTVKPTDVLEPFLDESGVFRNAGNTILGGDDKAAIAALLHATELLKASGEPFPSYELLFTVSEEQGLVGIKQFAQGALRSPLGVVLDGSGAVGGMVVNAPSMKTMRATFKGRAAHAGMEPERGRSAVQAAARAVAAMHLGRIDDETSANIGIIHGGVATNIVPETCVIEGECRGHDEQKLAAVASGMVDAVHQAAAEMGVDVEVDLEHEFPAFALSSRSPAVRLGKAALQAIGLESRMYGAGGGSDANILNARGLPTLNLSIGMMEVHSADEYLALDDLERLCSLILQIIRLAPGFAPGGETAER